MYCILAVRAASPGMPAGPETRPHCGHPDCILAKLHPKDPEVQRGMINIIKFICSQTNVMAHPRSYTLTKKIPAGESSHLVTTQYITERDMEVTKMIVSTAAMPHDPPAKISNFFRRKGRLNLSLRPRTSPLLHVSS